MIKAPVINYVLCKLLILKGVVIYQFVDIISFQSISIRPVSRSKLPTKLKLYSLVYDVALSLEI